MSVIMPPDSRAAVTVALRTLLSGRSEPHAQGATVGTRTRGQHQPGLPGLPYVLVASDGIQPVRSGAAYTDLIRVTVWHQTEDEAFDLAVLSQGLLAEHRGGVLRGLRKTGSLLRALDEDTQTPMCSALLNAALLPSTTT
ncbi:hypothetical protein [Streptomonospora salina]|uniref:hypothetical protein n=1 Tax=Streptomonospora salina TaxID=104205 RepID=UPI0031EB23CD